MAEVASAFGVNTATLWRWTKAFTSGGVLALVAERRGPKGPSKLTEALAARIVELEATGLTLLQIAAQARVSTATVRVALGRVTAGNQQPTQEQDEPASFVDAAAGETAVDHDQHHDQDAESGDENAVADLVVLAPPVPARLSGSRPVSGT